MIGEINYTDIKRPRTRSQTKSEIEPKDKGKQAVDRVPVLKKTSAIKIASEVPSERLIQLSKAIKVVSDVSGKTKEEEEIGLAQKKKASGTFAKLYTDLNLTSDSAQVKVQEIKAISDQSESVERKASWLKSSSDKSQDQNKKKSLFGSLGTSLYEESSMLTRLRLQGTRGKEAYDTTGLGHLKEKIETSSASTFRDPYPLTDKVGEAVTQKDLDKVESTQILVDTHDGTGDKEKMAIFPNNGRVYRISEADLLLKSLRELEHIHYMFEIRN